MRRHSATLGLLMAANYLVQAINMRAIAHLQYQWIAVTDAAICVLTFTMIRRVSEAKTFADMVCYSIGGTIGAVVGVWLSRSWG